MKNRFLLSILFIFTLIIHANAQTVDYNKIIIPSQVSELDIKERLVQLAWSNNPENRIAENEVLIAKKQVALASSDWLGTIRFSGNVNEFVLNPDADTDGRGAFYPKYNIGMSIPLNIFMAIPNKTSQARIVHDNQIENLKARKLHIRAEVLRLYANYKRDMELYKLQTNMTEEAYSNYMLSEQQFKNGEIPIEDYSSTSKSYFSELAAKIRAETTLEISKINLEEIIGVNLESVLSQYED